MIEIQTKVEEYEKHGIISSADNQATKLFSSDNDSTIYFFNMPTELMSSEELYITNHIPTQGENAVRFFNVLAYSNKHIPYIAASIHTYVFDGEMKSYNGNDLIKFVANISFLCPKIQSLTLKNFKYVEAEKMSDDAALSICMKRIFNPQLHSFTYENVTASIKFHNFVLSSITFHTLKEVAIKNLFNSSQHLIKHFLETIFASSGFLRILEISNVCVLDDEIMRLLVVYLINNKKLKVLILNDFETSGISDIVFDKFQNSVIHHKSLINGMMICKNHEKRIQPNFEKKIIC